MKAYFKRLFDYDQYTNLLILDLIGKTKNNAKACRTMAHLLASQRIWLTRSKLESTDKFVVWPEWPVDSLKLQINENHQSWVDFLETLNSLDFDKMISYHNSKGEYFEDQLSDILTHVINHGTHHRAQIGLYLKTEGIELPFTDYIAFTRNSQNS